MTRINLTDNADAIALKIKKARTDPEPLPGDIEGLAGRAEADNLIGIYAALADSDKAAVCSEFGGGQFSTFKTALADLAVEKIDPIGAEMRRLVDDPAHIDAVLKDGAARARTLAEPIWREVKEIVGFVGADG